MPHISWFGAFLERRHPSRRPSRFLAELKVFVELATEVTNEPPEFHLKLCKIGLPTMPIHNSQHLLRLFLDEVAQ